MYVFGTYGSLRLLIFDPTYRKKDWSVKVMIKDLFKSVLLVMVKLLTVDLNVKYPNPKVIALIKDQTEKKVLVSSG